METACIDDIECFPYFSVYGMFVYDELEEIIFEDVVSILHISIVSEFDLFCKSLACLPSIK